MSRYDTTKIDAEIAEAQRQYRREQLKETLAVLGIALGAISIGVGMAYCLLMWLTEPSLCIGY